jgi:hypothetical protein
MQNFDFLLLKKKQKNVNYEGLLLGFNHCLLENIFDSNCMTYLRISFKYVQILTTESRLSESDFFKASFVFQWPFLLTYMLIHNLKGRIGERSNEYLQSYSQSHQQSATPP